MRLWIELNHEFERLCVSEPPALDLLKRLWGYGSWCLAHGNEEVQTAAALGFCEHLMDTPRRRHVLPLILSRGEFIALRNLLLYHNSSDEVDTYLKTAWP